MKSDFKFIIKILAQSNFDFAIYMRYLKSPFYQDEAVFYRDCSKMITKHIDPKLQKNSDILEKDPNK